MLKKEGERESKGREVTPQVVENRSAIEERERRREEQGKWQEARPERRGEERRRGSLAFASIILSTWITTPQRRIYGPHQL
jgi:hypothetical protein